MTFDLSTTLDDTTCIYVGM